MARFSIHSSLKTSAVKLVFGMLAILVLLTVSMVVLSLDWAQAVEWQQVYPFAMFNATTNGLTVNVDGSSSRARSGTITEYAWDFGDGSSATGITASHTYNTGGSFAVILTITNNLGYTASWTKNVTVTAPPPPPTPASVPNLELQSAPEPVATPTPAPKTKRKPEPEPEPTATAISPVLSAAEQPKSPPAIPIIESIQEGNARFAADKMKGIKFKPAGKKTFNGKTIPNGTVHLYFHSNPFEDTTTADAQGNWSYELKKNLGSGMHTLKITATDPVTKLTSAESTPIRFTILAPKAKQVALKKKPVEVRNNYLPIYVSIVLVALAVLATVGFFGFRKVKAARQ